MSDENANKQMNGSWVFMSEAPAITIRKRDPFGCDSTGLQQEHSFIDGWTGLSREQSCMFEDFHHYCTVK